MDSKDESNADGHQNTTTEYSDTVALQKKRARRVSFAEMTSIHFFDRDDEEFNKTPMVHNAKFVDDSGGELGFREHPKEFGGEDNEDDDLKDGNDDEEMEMRRSFLRPIGSSPSSGGSTIGSASSNDEDNFFGPVSANFIRPGRLSDSAASDDNHDVTMDSTAFSMHFRSLDRSDSGVDLRTQTGGQLFFDEKTPTNATIGSSMLFTLGKKPKPKTSPHITDVSGDHNSNDMSLVGENPHKYDYDKLSPGLDALLAESRENLLSASISDDHSAPESPKRKEGEVLPSTDHGDNIVNLSDYARKERGWTNHDLQNEEVSADHSVIDEAVAPLGIFSNGLSPKKLLGSTSGMAASNANDHKSNRSPRELSKSGSGTPLVASTSSPVIRGKIVSTATSPSNHFVGATPLLEKPGSLIRSESVGHHKTETSIQKSISKLESLAKSTFSNTFSARVDRSTIKSLDFLKSPNLDTVLKRNGHISGSNFVNCAVSEEKPASGYQSKERSYASSLDDKRFETLDHIIGENHLEASPNNLKGKNLLTEQSKYGGTATSPSKMTWSGVTLMRSLFTSKDSGEDALLTETESLLAEIASGDGEKSMLTSPMFVSSPSGMLGKKITASPGLPSSRSKDLMLQSRNKKFLDSDKAHDSTPGRNIVDIDFSITANTNAASIRMNGDLDSPFVEVNNQKKMTEVEETHYGVAMPEKENVGTSDNFISPAKQKISKLIHPNIVDVGNLPSRDVSRFEDNLQGVELGAVSPGSISACARNLDEPMLQDMAEFPTASPSRKELEHEQSPRVPSPKLLSLEIFSANKRNLESLLTDMEHRTEMSIMQRSPKLQKGGNCDPNSLPDPIKGSTTVIGQERKKWTDIYSKLSEDMKDFIPRSADKLNFKMIDEVEDMLLYQQRVQNYEMLRCGVIPQNATVLHHCQLEKVSETHSLFNRVVFEKAKLQLKQIKRERLLKRLQILSSRIQGAQTLGTSISSLPLEKCTSNVLSDNVGNWSFSVSLKRGHEVSRETLAAMTQTSEALDKKILDLKRSFHACCKIKVEPSYADTIALVNEHMMKRASCRFIRTDMQMWVVQSVSSVNGQQSVVLNYLDFIIQSIKIVVGPTSSAAISYILNDTNITKNFPNMDACTAFAFMFSAETILKYVGTKTLVRETQVTSSILGTLLDVFEEVQVANVEFPNLIQSSFCSASAEQLHLMLCFFNFKTGKKVNLTLDMTCLKRGIYPSDILPLELSSPVDSRKFPVSETVNSEFRDAVKGVRSGYMRIFRLCRCLSQVVQTSSA